MSTQSRQRNWMEIEQLGDVSVAKFGTRHILEEDKLHRIGAQLACLGEDAGPQHLLINMDGVQRLSTEMVGKFMALHRAVKDKGGRLLFCNVHPNVFQIFRICKLPETLPFFETEQDALQSLEAGVSA